MKRFALGAATGMPASSNNAKATGCAGTRKPTVPNPAVTSSGTAAIFFTTIVNGPGQKASANFRAATGHSAANARAAATSAT